MLTIFSTCKPFLGQAAITQRNAITSWVQLGHEVEVILVGNDTGTAEIAQELCIRHIPEVEHTELGTPLVSSIFQKAQQAALHPVVCYVNADIILMSDFLQAVRRVQAINFQRFLLVGQRWDLEVASAVDFGAQDWQKDLAEQVMSRGYLYAPAAIDYFVFPKGQWNALPPLIIGRPAWDHWMIHNALIRQIPIIDGTSCVQVVHQSHDYGHRAVSAGGSRSNPEVAANLHIAGEMEGFDIQDATWLLTKDSLVRSLSFHRMRRYAYYVGIRYPWLRIPLQTVGRVLRHLRILKTPHPQQSH